MVDLKDLIKSGEKLAKSMLLDSGMKQLVPMFHLVAPDGGTDAVIGCEWRDNDEKYYLISKVKEQAHQMGAVAAMFMTEAWMSIQGPNAALGMLDPPSQQPNREEVVMAMAIDNDGNQEFDAWNIVRSSPGGTIIALIKRKQDMGYMRANIIDGLLPPKKG